MMMDLSFGGIECWKRVPTPIELLDLGQGRDQLLGPDLGLHLI